ncbi:MAG TPA: YlbF family regulator [Clostridia bacterium]|nr:YlbF family regulator [Clostridia bacterium]
MHITFEESPVLQKTKELCQIILDQPNMKSIRQRIDAFMNDEKTRAQYDGLVNKGQALQQKQQMSMALSREEIDDFEKHRDALLNNPVARGFLDAQEELQQVQHSVHHYVTKTLELGRLPTDEEASGKCGAHDQGGCGCGHSH